MAGIGRNLKKQGVIMTLLSLVLMNTGCEEQIDPANIPSEGGEMVGVSLNIGFADEVDGATLTNSAATKSDKASAFDMQLLPATRTKAANDYPDKLYNLEIYQYNSSGACILSKTIGTSEVQEIGADINTTLDANGGAECQLLIIARGATPAVSSLSGKALSAVNLAIADATVMEGINAGTGDNINNMPYLLYLPKVKIVSGKLVSPEGTDVRLLLKRLAVKLTINWHFNVNGYALKEVRLMQVPKDYRILPATEEMPPYGTMYPNSVSEFIDGFRLKGEELTSAGTTKTIWMPANARGTRSDVTYPTYRNKNYAHSAATYVEFVVDGENNEQRLFYRAYLGGNETTDFNLLENTNYNWTINLNSANYTGDPRIQLIDLTPVVSTNFQSATSNCFMMLPGTNICFNPYKHEAGTDGWNTRLVADNAIISGKTITSVKVLWQTKDAGTTGNLVMGYVIDGDHHENLVNLTDGGDIDKARIHIKVPNTQGGNAVIAAYNGTTVVWSWHLWISDYVPVGLSGEITSATRAQAIETAQNATKGGMVHVYGGISWTDPNGAFYKKVIMDRNLGATKAGIQTNLLDGVRTFGLLYQGGRKDPFFSSADGTKNETKTIYDGDGKEVEIEKKKNENGVTDYDNTIKNPKTYYLANSGDEEKKAFNKESNAWGPTGSKTIYDPCPKGWRVPSNTAGGVSDPKQCMMAGFGSTNLSWVPEATTPQSCSTLKYYDGEKLRDFGSANVAASDFVGSGFIYTAVSGDEMELDKISNKSAFFPGVSLREQNSGLYRDKVGNVPNQNNTVYLWASSVDVRNDYKNLQHIYQFQTSLLSFQHTISRAFGFSVRCVQDN